VFGAERYPVRHTPKRGLRQVNFVFDGSEIRGLEQNPETKSRWAQMARFGKKVMQFLSEGRYMANVVDGKVTLYGRRAGNNSWVSYLSFTYSASGATRISLNWYWPRALKQKWPPQSRATTLIERCAIAHIFTGEA
jgi:hypothetical protein